MFRESYRSDNEKIKPDEGLLRYVSVRMKQEAAVTEAVRSEPSPGSGAPCGCAPASRARAWRRWAAVAAACAVLLLSGGGLYVRLLKKSAAPPADVSAAAGTAAVGTGPSYSEIYALVKRLSSSYAYGYGTAEAAKAGIQNGSAASVQADGAQIKTAADNSFSSTNVQVDGVDEADILKTDGRYIYALVNGEAVIVSADGADMAVVSRLSWKNDERAFSPSDLYVTGDRLIVLASVGTADASVKTAAGTAAQDTAVCGVGSYAYAADTALKIYDIRDRTQPKMIADLGQNGGLLSSRLADGILYCVSQYTLYDSRLDESDPATFVPQLYRDGSGTPLAAQDITLSPDPRNRQYVVAAAYDVGSGGTVSSKAVLGEGSILYASTESLYLAFSQTKVVESDVAVPVSSDPNDGEITTLSYQGSTTLLHFSLNKGEIELKATGTVPGRVLNQFSMDEYGGVLRIVTTNAYSQQQQVLQGQVVSVTPLSEDSRSALYTLDGSLKLLGKIEDIAPGERVYSVRFDGDIGYFVTFRQVDPLFTVDLSDPASPKILSALKIPGFSQYLHPYGDGLLFGFGMAANASTGRTEGLKLSMFNTADPADVTEQSTLNLPYQWSDASYNHKAILVSAERGLIAFPADSNYVLYTWDASKGFRRLAEIDLGEYYGSQRGLYIGGTFYVFDTQSLRAYSLTDYHLQATLSLS